MVALSLLPGNKSTNHTKSPLMALSIVNSLIMANYNDRQTTLTRLSKLRQEIQHLTDSLTRPSKSAPLSSVPSTTPKYNSELEAKYVGHKYDSSRYASVGSQLPQRSHTWTSHRHHSDSTGLPSGRGQRSLGDDSSEKAFRETMVISETEARYLSSSNRLQVIEDKYLHSAVPWMPGSNIHESDSRVAKLTHSVSESGLWTGPRNPLKLSDGYGQRNQFSTGQSMKEKANKYSWRPSSRRSLTGSEVVSRARNRIASESSSSSQHQRPDDNRSRYRFDKRTDSAPTHIKHRHSIDHRRPSTSHAAHVSSKSSSDKSSMTHTHSHSSSQTKAVSATSSIRSSANAKYSTPLKGHRIDGHDRTSHFRSRGHGLHEYSRRRGTSSRGHALTSRRGWETLTFRGRGERGYSTLSYRGRVSTRTLSRGARLYRGRGSSGHRSPHSHRTSFFEKGSSSKMSSQDHFCSIYALRTSKEWSRKSLTFMERRRQAVLNKGPALLRSKFNLVRGHQRHSQSGSSVASPASSSNVGSARKLVTVKKTRTKLVRRREGERRFRGSLVNLHGDKYKLRINRFSKALYRIPAETQMTRSSKPSSHPGSGPRKTMKSAAPSITRRVASHVLQRSIHISLAARKRSEKRSTGKKYCMFYNLYGQCKKGNSCDYVHDPEKVAVCTRFLQGNCPNTDGSCLFSHKVSKEKMPVCSYFLRGVCNRDDCPYSHVKVSGRATVCPDFIKGYCALGDKCKRKHTLRCAEFAKTGKCENGKKCTLLHKRDPSSGSNKNGVKMKTSSKRLLQTPRNESRIPGKRTKTNDDVTNTPSFIKLSLDTPVERRMPSKSDNREEGSIIPSFLRFSTSDQKSKRVSDDAASKHGTHAKSKTVKKARTPSKTSSKKRTNHKVPESTHDKPQDLLEQSPQPSKSRGCSPAGEEGAPLSPVISIISEMPSFIELCSEDTPVDPVEESPHQESEQGTLRIRPQFSR